MSDLYMRTCSMNIGGRVLTYPPMSMEFETEFAGAAPAQTKAKIFNPAPDTVAACEKKKNVYPKIIIEAGYVDDYGICAVGEIVKFEEKKGIDTTLELTISDKTSLWASAVVNKSWKGIISASDAVDQILKEFGITSCDKFFGEDRVYENGLAFNGVSFKSAMERIARDTKSVFTFRNGQASFLAFNKGTGRAFVLGYDSGLLSIEKTSTGYNVKSLFMYRIGFGSLVKIDKPDFTAVLRVFKGKHSFSPGSAGSEFEARRI